MKLLVAVSMFLGLYNTGALARRDAAALGSSELYSGNSPRDNKLFGMGNPFSSFDLPSLGLGRQNDPTDDIAAARDLAEARAAAARASASSRFSSFSRRGGFGSSYSYGI